MSYENGFLPGLHPDDRERIGNIIPNLYNLEVSNGDYDVECRIIGVKGEKIRWVHAKGKVFFDDDNKPLRFIGSVSDTDKNEKNNGKMILLEW